MIINRSFKEFKFRHRSKKNQIIYTSKKVKNDDEVLNLIDNFLMKKIVLYLSLLKKVKSKEDILFLEKILIKFGNLIIIILILIKNNKKIKLKDKPEKLIEKIIEDFKFKTPKNLPKICSLISGYFSYDSIRYIEKIPNNCKNDLNLTRCKTFTTKNTCNS